MMLEADSDDGSRPVLHPRWLRPYQTTSSRGRPPSAHSLELPMSRSRISVTLIGAIALAACNADRIDQVNPLTVSPSRVVSAAAPTRYIILAKNSGFKADFG